MSEEQKIRYAKLFKEYFALYGNFDAADNNALDDMGLLPEGQQRYEE